VAGTILVSRDALSGVVKQLALLLCIREVLGSNPSDWLS
jgi:hypothetical protein